MSRPGFRILVVLAAVAAAATMPLQAQTAMPPALFEPPPPAPPDDLKRLQEFGADERFRGGFAWSESTRDEVAAWQGDPSRYVRESLDGLTEVTFYGPGQRCLEVLPGEARPGGRVTVGPCSGLETQIFLADHRAPYGTLIVVRPFDGGDGRNYLCVDRSPSQDGTGGELRLARCQALYFEAGVGPVADRQRWNWMFPDGPAPLEAATVLVRAQIWSHGALCVVPDAFGHTITAAILGDCPSDFSDRSPSTWVLMERR